MKNPNWLKYLDEDRQAELLEEYVDIDDKGKVVGRFRFYDNANPQTELLIQLIKEIRKANNNGTST